MMIIFIAITANVYRIFRNKKNYMHLLVRPLGIKIKKSYLTFGWEISGELTILYPY